MTARPHAIPTRPQIPEMPLARPQMRDVPAWSGMVTIALGVVVLLGWLLDANALKSMIPGLPTMKPSTAIVFVLMGFGLVLRTPSVNVPRAERAGALAFAVALGIALATAAEYLFAIDLGAELIVVRGASGELGTILPGRMAPPTVIAFLALASAAFAATRAPRLTTALCGVGLMVSALNILNFLFAATGPPILANYAQMAVNTASGLGAIALGILASLGKTNPFASLADDTPSAHQLRRLLLVALTVPTVIMWLRLQGQSLGLYDTSFGASLVVVGVTGLSLLAVLSAARSARRTEAGRQAAELERDRFFDLSIDLLAVFDSEGCFQRVSPAWESTMGFGGDALLGTSVYDLIHPDDQASTRAAVAKHFESGDHLVGFQNRCRRGDGTDRWLEWTSRLAPDGTIAFVVARDITDRKRLEARRARLQNLLAIRNEALAEHAIRDPLTGLHNRRYFDAEIDRRERRRRREPSDPRVPVSVILFDLDHFGEVNKRHGHQVGDIVLRRFADLLRDRLRGIDLVARYGGEEFVVVLEGATSSDASRIAEGVRAALAAQSIDINEDTPLRVTVSAGCAQLVDGSDFGAALALADVWMAQAKRGGRNQVIGL